MRRILILLISLPFLVSAQKPVINSFSPTHIEVNQTVTISGSNLAGAKVFFGGVEATVTSSTTNTIKALVPAGVRNDVITVLNNNLIAQSSQQFFISFSGSDISNFSDEYLLSTDRLDGFDICLCDLNADDLNDAVIAHNTIDPTNFAQEEITIFQNTSSIATTQFTKVSNIQNGDNTGGLSAVTCGDVDNDGKPDLVFTTSNGQNAKQIFVYLNTSTAGGSITLAYQSSLSLSIPASGSTNRTPRRLQISDIDGDGKADLVIGNNLDNTIHIFRNTSDGSISFGSPTEISVGNAQSTGSISVADLNSDRLPDIASLAFRQANSQIYILKNTSTVGQIKFELEAGIQQNSQRVNVALGDFDNDGLTDLAVTSDQLRRVRIYKNNSADGDITFQTSSPTTISLSSGVPWGIDLGDLNGDGLLDISVPSVGSSLGIFIAENTTSGSTITFDTPTLLATPLTARNVRIADINGDAKPDIAFTHNITTSATTDLGVFTNQNCVVPTISPDDLEFCFGDPFTLNATKSLGTTYSWQITAGSGPAITDTDDEASVQIDSGSPATIEVTITGASGCSQTASASFSLLNGTPPGAPTITGTPTDVVCVGDDFTLSTAASDSYEWTKPDGSVVTTQDLAITNASFSDGGTYSLRVKTAGGCFSLVASVDVEISSAPSVNIFNPALDNFCTGESVSLSIPDLGAGFSYQWQLNDANIDGSTGTTITASQTGDYTVIVTDNATMCENETEAKSLRALSVPVSAIDQNTQVCNGFPTNFTSSSTGEAGFPLKYYWVIETQANDTIHESYASSITNFTFPDAEASYEVWLTVGYDSTIVNACGNQSSMAVTVADPPTIEFTQTDGVEKCQGESINIGINSPNSSEITSYSWEVRSAANSPNDTLITAASTTNSTIDISTPVNIDSVFAIVTITTSTGCTVKDSIKVRNFSSTADISTPDGFDLTNDTVTLENEFFINLEAQNIVSDFQWSPEELIDNPTASTVRVFPDQQIVPVSVTGTDVNNCTVVSQVIIEIDIVRPKKTFSPNGDGKNDCWEVYNVSTFDCEAYIFDSRGRNILVTSDFDENCVWDGNFNGSPVPEGVYYYVIKCDNGTINKSGSILLAR